MGRSTVRALLSDRAVVLGSRSPVHGPRQDGAAPPGQVLCSGMESVLSLDWVTQFNYYSGLCPALGGVHHKTDISLFEALLYIIYYTQIIFWLS